MPAMGRSQDNRCYAAAAAAKAIDEKDDTQQVPSVTESHSHLLGTGTFLGRRSEDNCTHFGPDDHEGRLGYYATSSRKSRLQAEHLERRIEGDRAHNDEFRLSVSLPNMLGLQEQRRQNALLQRLLSSSSAGELGQLDQRQQREVMGYGQHRGTDHAVLEAQDSSRVPDQRLQSTVAGKVSSSYVMAWNERDKEMRRLNVWLDALRGEKALRVLERQKAHISPSLSPHEALQSDMSPRINPSSRPLDMAPVAPRTAVRPTKDPLISSSASSARGHHIQKNSNEAVSQLKRGEGLPLAQPTDKGFLSDYQLLIRESLSLFQMQESDILLAFSPGRKIKPIAGQIGVRCRYCENVPLHHRGGGAIYFPSSVSSVYQAAQNIAANHLMKTCTSIPCSVKEQLVAARKQLKNKPRRSGGNSYWMETSQHLGLVDHEGVKGVWIEER